MLIEFSSPSSIGKLNNDILTSSISNAKFIDGIVTSKAAELNDGYVNILMPNRSCFTDLTECVSFTFSAYIKIPNDAVKNIFSTSWLKFHCKGFNDSLPLRRYCKIEVFSLQFLTIYFYMPLFR